jgi:two-component system, NarL family, nitrate/nitrite response regulator NarL
MHDMIGAAEPGRVRIAVFEEYELYRAGLCRLLSMYEGMEIVGQSSTWSEALSLVRREHPDVLLYAIGDGESASVEHLADIITVSENTKVLALSGSNDPEQHRQVIRSGAAGVLSKDKPAEMLVKAMERINAGESWLDRSTTASLLRELSSKKKPAMRTPDQIKIAALSERERDVITLVGKGMKNKQIAKQLFISDITVHHHLTSVYSKLDISDRMELLIFSYRNGLADLPR